MRPSGTARSGTAPTPRDAADGERASYLYFEPALTVRVGTSEGDLEEVAGTDGLAEAHGRQGLQREPQLPKRMTHDQEGGHAGKDGLETIAKDFRDALRRAVPKDAKLMVGIKLGGHMSEAFGTLARVNRGGAYCELPDLVRKFVTLTQPTGEQGQTAQIEAHLRYREIAGRLAALTPERSPF